MPSFRYRCRKCGWMGYLLVRAGDKTPKVCSCKYLLTRAPAGPSSQVLEKLDNGVMPRAVERLSEAERFSHERAAKSDPLAGGGVEIPGTKR